MLEGHSNKDAHHALRTLGTIQVEIPLTLSEISIFLLTVQSARDGLHRNPGSEGDCFTHFVHPDIRELDTFLYAITKTVPHHILLSQVQTMNSDGLVAFNTVANPYHYCHISEAKHFWFLTMIMIENLNARTIDFTSTNDRTIYSDYWGREIETFYDVSVALASKLCGAIAGTSTHMILWECLREGIEFMRGKLTMERMLV